MQVPPFVQSVDLLFGALHGMFRETNGDAIVMEANQKIKSPEPVGACDPMIQADSGTVCGFKCTEGQALYGSDAIGHFEIKSIVVFGTVQAC